MLTSKTSVVGSDDPHLFVCILSLRSTFYLFIGMILSQSHLFKQQNCCLHSGNQLVSGYQWWYHCWIFMVAIIPFGFGVVLFFTKKTHLTFRNQDFLQNPQISSESPRIPRIIIRTISNHHEVRPTFVPPVVDPRLLTTHRWLPAAGVGPSTNWRESGTSMIHNTCVYISGLYVEYNIYILLKMIV